MNSRGVLRAAILRPTLRQLMLGIARLLCAGWEGNRHSRDACRYHVCLVVMNKTVSRIATMTIRIMENRSIGVSHPSGLIITFDYSLQTLPFFAMCMKSDTRNTG